MKITTNAQVEKVFENYPDNVRDKMGYLRKLVIETAEETESITSLEDPSKWGEPSYLVKKGSTLRMDWKAKTPDQYAMYFKCTSRLVETFKVVFDSKFKFEGKRAIVFQIDDKISVKELKQCIKATLIYHDVKKLVTLGI